MDTTTATYNVMKAEIDRLRAALEEARNFPIPAELLRKINLALKREQ